MTMQEFKAWFDGFTEAMSGTPTKAQWERIKARVAEIDGITVTERVFVDRYWPTYPHFQYLRYTPAYSTSNGGISTSNAVIMNSDEVNFNGIQAMYALGTADASS